MEEEMEEKEKLERGEIIEKKPAATPSERTAASTAAATEEAQPGEVEELELTAENCEAKLADLKADLDQTAPLGRDTSFDRWEEGEREVDVRVLQWSVLQAGAV